MMDQYKYILEGHKAVPCDDLIKWAEWYESTFKEGLENGKCSRIVAKTKVGEAEVSTVFLAINHSWSDGPPLLFETMCFGLPEGHPLKDYQDRCSTWEQAEAMHAEAVAKLKRSGIEGAVATD